MDLPSEQAQIVSQWFDIFGNAMERDVLRAIDSEANYLAALGIACYAETVGAILMGTITTGGKTEDNFNEFLPLLGQDYVAVDTALKNPKSLLHNPRGLYDVLRNGLVHRYLLKMEGGVARDSLRNQGVYIDGSALIVVLRKFHRDFQHAMTRARDRLLPPQGQPSQAVLKYMERAVLLDRSTSGGGVAWSGAMPNQRPTGVLLGPHPNLGTYTDTPPDRAP